MPWSNSTSWIFPRRRERVNGLDRFVQARAHELAAMIIEPLVQGAGGMRFHPAAVLARLRSLAKKHDVLFIADEIATGFWRTGNRFACEEAGIVPDILCLGKALSGGTITLGATLAQEWIFQAFLSDDWDHALMHGPTFMANPLACAAADAVPRPVRARAKSCPGVGDRSRAASGPRALPESARRGRRAGQGGDWRCSARGRR